MISQIRFKAKTNTTTSSTKNSKAFSLLGMGLHNLKKQQIIPKHKGIDNLKINIRSSNADNNSCKNDWIDNNSSKHRNHSFQTTFLSHPTLHQNNENIITQQTKSENEDVFYFLNKKQHVAQITNSETNINIQDKIFDEIINNEPSFLTFENITNREERVDQGESKKYLTSLNYIFMEDIKAEKQNEDKNKNINIYVDMKKKIKKLSKTQKPSGHEQRSAIRLFKSRQNDYLQKKKSQLTVIHNQMLKNIYKDTEVIVDGCIFRNKIVPQRIDNDVDTDDEQINSGIRRLHKSLFQVVQQNMPLAQKIDIVSFKPFRQTAEDHSHCHQEVQDN